MSNTRIFAPGALLPPLWLFEVPALYVDAVLVDRGCWIVAPNDTTAIEYLRHRHRAKGITTDLRARGMRVAQMSPTEDA
jgi:hypothetical protein